MEARPQLLAERLLGPGVVGGEEEPVELGAAGGVGREQRAERDGHGHTRHPLAGTGFLCVGAAQVERLQRARDDAAADRVGGDGDEADGGRRGRADDGQAGDLGVAPGGRGHVGQPLDQRGGRVDVRAVGAVAVGVVGGPVDLAAAGVGDDDDRAEPVRDGVERADAVHGHAERVAQRGGGDHADPQPGERARARRR